MVVAEHVAVRPGWQCPIDGEPWPCEARRAALLAEIMTDDRAYTSLLMYLAAVMEDAINDLPHKSAADMWSRFLGWALRPTPPPAGPTGLPPVQRGPGPHW